MRWIICSACKFLVQSVKVREGRIGEVTEILAWYEFINDIILDHLDDEIKSTDQSGVWRYLISFKVNTALRFKDQIFEFSPQNLLRAIENTGIVSVYGIRYLTTGNVTQQNFIKYCEIIKTRSHNTSLRYVEHDTLIWEYLNSSIHLAPYLEEKFRKIYAGDAYKFYRQR